MRAAFGKVNTLHNHVLSWTDRPLVSNNLVGGEDGISDAGISVARLIPNPWIFLEATGQVFRGDSGPDENPLYRTSHRGQASFVGHLRGYQDLSESTNIDLGVSVSRAQRVWRPGGDRRLHHTAPWRGCHASMAPAAAIHLSLVHRAIRSDLEPARSAQRTAGRLGLLRLGRLSVRAALVRRRPPGRIGPRLRRGAARHRRFGDSHLLAERIQPGARQYRRTTTPSDRWPTSSCSRSSFRSAHGAHPF